MIRFILLFLILITTSCNSSKNIADWNFTIPNKDFDDTINYPPIDYSKSKNWMFYDERDDVEKILPKNYDNKNDSLYNVSVFYIHPTTLYNSSNWNADTSFLETINF